MTEPQTAPPAQPSAAEKRRQRLAALTFRNMILSVLGVLAFVLVWWSISPNPDSPQPRAVETALTSKHAAETAAYPLWVPEPGEGWTPTVVWYDPLEELLPGAEVPTWHMSWVSPEGRYVALHQAQDVPEAWVEEVLDGAKADGEVTLEGPTGEQVWQRYAGKKDSNTQIAYLLGPEGTDGSTVVLHGTAEQDEFETFLGSVEARD